MARSCAAMRYDQMISGGSSMHDAWHAQTWQQHSIEPAFRMAGAGADQGSDESRCLLSICFEAAPAHRTR